MGDPVLFYRRTILDYVSRGELQKICYLSSTSVYGDAHGSWVDEDFPPNPVTESAIARLNAEKGWLDFGVEIGIDVSVLRLGGIYGPGRSALDTLIQGGALSKNQMMRQERRYTARVHVADVCQAIKAVMEKPSSRKIYNVVDDDPAPRSEVFSFAKSLIEQKRLKQLVTVLKEMPEVADLHSHTTDDLLPEKRVLNARLKNDLGVNLMYPSYRDGLNSIAHLMDVKYLDNLKP